MEQTIQAGTVTAICISEKRGTQKKTLDTARLRTDQGIEGDAHAGHWHRQVSLLSQEEIDAFRAEGADVYPGAFGENLAVQGIPFFETLVQTKYDTYIPISCVINY